MLKEFKLNQEIEINPEWQDPEVVVMGIYNEICSRGANDYEHSAIEDILGRYKNKKISGAEAISEARLILEAKQDYH
ncbi:hypothetical protein KKC17_02940 [Patescibacteria group bacterium]|nr:hypothetical protein [Patescibacteria group bacterium]